MLLRVRVCMSVCDVRDSAHVSAAQCAVMSIINNYYLLAVVLVCLYIHIFTLLVDALLCRSLAIYRLLYHG